MPGKTEYRITFGTRSKPPVVRENSVEVCDMIPAFLDQNMSWFSLPHFRPKYVIFPALFKIKRKPKCDILSLLFQTEISGILPSLFQN